MGDWYSALAPAIDDAVNASFGVSGTYVHTETSTSELVTMDTHEPYLDVDLGGETDQATRVPAGDVKLSDLSAEPLVDDTFTPDEGPEAGNTLRIVNILPDGDGAATLRFMRT